MKFFTSDTHFGNDAYQILDREYRPFKIPQEYANFQIDLWNNQTSENDIIYHWGDFCNYKSKEHDFESGLLYVKKIKAKVVLIIGNNEERVIEHFFNGSFAEFKKYCLNIGFLDVVKNCEITINEEKFYLVHKPSEHHPTIFTLFGHLHKITGIWKPFGLNVGTDLKYFSLFSENDILDLKTKKEKYFDEDLDINCFK